MSKYRGVLIGMLVTIACVLFEMTSTRFQSGLLAKIKSWLVSYTAQYGVPLLSVKSVRLFGNEPGGAVTSTRKFADAGETCAAGVPVNVTVAFWVTGESRSAVNVTVTPCPATNVAGVKLA